MAVSDEFLKYITDQFSTLGAVRTKRMFGGVGIYHDEKFFALIDNDTLYLKTDIANEPRFKKAGMTPFQPWPGHIMNYWTIPSDVLENKEALAEWSKGALAAASHATKPPSRRHTSAPSLKSRGRRSGTTGRHPKI
jgi:DNA transformation protein